MKRDPSGELAGWMKGVMNMQSTEEQDGKYHKFDMYLTMLKNKITEISRSEEAGLFDSRFEELQNLSRVNQLSGMLVLQKKWQGNVWDGKGQATRVYEEAALLSSAYAQDVKEGRAIQDYAPLTKDDLNYFFRGGPKPDSEVAQDASAPAEDGVEPAAAAQSSMPDYYHEGGTRPTGGQGIRGSWEQIAIDEDAADVPRGGSTEAPSEESTVQTPPQTLTEPPAGSPGQPIQTPAQAPAGPVSEGSMQPPQGEQQHAADTSTGKLWRYPFDGKTAFTQQGLLYDESQAVKRRRL